MTARFSVTIRQVREDGSEVPLDAGLAAWTADEARYLDHGDREKVIAEEGRSLQQDLLQATFSIDAAREERAARVTSAARVEVNRSGVPNWFCSREADLTNGN